MVAKPTVKSSECKEAKIWGVIVVVIASCFQLSKLAACQRPSMFGAIQRDRSCARDSLFKVPIGAEPPLVKPTQLVLLAVAAGNLGRCSATFLNIFATLSGSFFHWFLAG